MAANQCAGSLQRRQICANRHRGSGESPRKRDDRNAPALLQQVTNPSPPLFDEQSRLYRALRRAQLGARVIAGMRVMHKYLSIALDA